MVEFLDADAAANTLVVAAFNSQAVVLIDVSNPTSPKIRSSLQAR